MFTPKELDELYGIGDGPGRELEDQPELDKLIDDLSIDEAFDPESQ